MGFKLDFVAGHFEKDDGSKALFEVVADERLFFGFQKAVLDGVIPDRFIEGGPKAGDVGAAVSGSNGVGKGFDVFVVGVVVLEGDVNTDIETVYFLIAGEGDDVVERLFVFVDVLN